MILVLFSLSFSFFHFSYLSVPISVLRFRHLLYFDFRSKFDRSAVLMSNLQSALLRWQQQALRNSSGGALEMMAETTSALKVSTLQLLLQMQSGKSGDSSASHQSSSEQIKVMLAYLYIYLFGVAAALAAFLAEVLFFYGCCWLT